MRTRRACLVTAARLGCGLTRNQAAGLLPAGMRGDRAQVIFSALEELKRFLVDGCDGTS